ncbi:VOC family protein [Dysgonomonas sp. HGC4]|uniref:VOC family protein n=1 Tax=Dysgonomonas sp. HGC4 TaxID=1658009 RepID=UPI000682BF57|nr:glyoxalase [Dysgonomonas sp. HGC4]MBD8348043.1 VOC family protein [Dysgonomonas sp. HGC4]
MKNLIAFFEIPAVDLDRAIKFYQSVLNTQFTVCDWGKEKMAFFPEEDGVCPGAISWSDHFKPSKDGVLISLNCKNMETSLSLVEINGGKITIPKTKIEADNRGYFSVFIDSEGNSIGLYSDF